MYNDYEDVLIHWTPAKVKRLKDAYTKAVDNNEPMFVIITNEGILKFHTGYAKYLIEHLDSVPELNIH